MEATIRSKFRNYLPFAISNVFIDIVMSLTTMINGVKRVNKKVNQHRIKEIKKYYENRLGTIINLE